MSEFEFDGELYVKLEDHIASVALLIEDNKVLTDRLDKTKTSLLRCRRQAQARSESDSRQARWDADYVPYGEDRDE